MRIRLEDDGHDRFNIILPGLNKDFPIGVIWKDPFRKETWRTKRYFPIFGMSQYSEDQVYDDSMKAARALANLFNHNNIVKFEEDEDYKLTWGDATD